MNPLVLVDTGPLVALRRENDADQRENDADHKICTETLKQLPTPLLTCWPVLTEAAYLLRSHPARVRELLAAVNGGFLRVLPLRSPDVVGINAILEQYEDQSFQLADAALMHLAQRENVSTIFTLDRKDFSVYRPASGKSLVILPA